MQMKNGEIIYKYQQNKGDTPTQNFNQIKILAQLNACKPNDIIDVLNEGGVQNVPKKRGNPHPENARKAKVEKKAAQEVEQKVEQKVEQPDPKPVIEAQRKTITEQIQEAIDEMCENYCKYQMVLKGLSGEEWRELTEKLCDNCPLCRL